MRFSLTLEKLQKTAAAAVLFTLPLALSLSVSASTIEELTQQQQENQGKLNEVNSQIADLEDEQSIIEEELADLNAELIDMMTSISLLEDEISEKEKEIDVTIGEIAEAQTAYEEAVLEEQSQYEAMKIRIRFMYENGNASYADLFFGTANFGDLLTKAEYIENLYDYDRKLLQRYKETADRVAALKQGLEEKKASLETERASLEASKKSLVDEQAQLNVLKAQKKAESDQYEAQIKAAEAKAAEYKKQIAAEAAQIKKLQEQARQAQNQTAAANRNYTVTKFDTSVVSASAGSDLGKKIALYGLQYIGNPYVAGGTSLTSGADCSGFTYRIYSDFGYSIPRTSYAQRNAGTGVGSLDQAQPGDLICYDGHVGLYVGGGYIVHASTEKTGIKVSRANYRSIAAIRRIVK